MKFNGKWRCNSEQDAKGFYYTLTDWGLTCKLSDVKDADGVVEKKMISVEGNYNHPENIRNYMMFRQVEIEFTITEKVVGLTK